MEMEMVSGSQNGGEGFAAASADQKKRVVENPSVQKLTLPPLSVNSQRQNYSSAEKTRSTKSTKLKIKSNSHQKLMTGKSSSLAHLERYEENKYLKKIRNGNGQQKPPKQIDYLKEMKEKRINKKTAKK